MKRIPKVRLGEGLEIARVLTGLWQVADIEKDCGSMDADAGADALERYVRAGFDSFDMADHYGSAELIAGRLLARGVPATICTKWCPAPGPMTADVVRAGVEERLDRLGTDRVDLLQFHWWSFEHPAWLDALHEMAALRDEGLIGEIGVTNFDAAHLALALADGLPIVSNQVPLSLVDRRATGALTRLAAQTGVRLLAYGTLAGGFLTERWVDRAAPSAIADWSKTKYRRFIDAAGGWETFQTVLDAAAEIARKHGVSIANVATRWVLEQPAVASVIIGARLGERDHSDANRMLFDFSLDDEDRARLEAAFANTVPVPGDCGDEYRRPPFLTASGDLSHHLERMPSAHAAEPAPHRADAERVLTGVKWEDMAGYCRAQRVGERIVVSGTTATGTGDRIVARGDAGGQATFVLDRIAAALSALGGSIEDVVRTRIYLVDPADVDAVVSAHGRVFGSIKPANTLIVAGGLIGDYRVEIEAEAILRPAP